MTVTLPTSPTMAAARRAAEATLGDTGTVTRPGVVAPVVAVCRAVNSTRP